MIDSIYSTASAIRSGEESSISVTRSILARIEQLNPTLNAYAYIDKDGALNAADQADVAISSGRNVGPLHGIPLAVKDLHYTRGIATTGGMKHLKDFLPAEDGTAIQRLKSAGAIILGKLNLTEGAMSGYHREFSVPQNPWNNTYWPGASSSGSGVAVAAGLCFGATGTDTGGSIRFPCMANGITGLKPTYGRISRHGLLGLAPSLDHIGPMARSVRDVAIMLDALSGHDPLDETSLKTPPTNVAETLECSVAGLRIGYDADYIDSCASIDLIQAIELAIDVMADLGAIVTPIKLPPGYLELIEPWFAIASHEAWKEHQLAYFYYRHTFGDYFGQFLDVGASKKGLLKAQKKREKFTHQFKQVLSTVDAIACPAGGAPFKIAASQYSGVRELSPSLSNALTQFTVPANFAGTPALTFPCGKTKEGLPLSVQLLGAAGSESTLCCLGHAFQTTTRWHLMSPFEEEAE